MSYSDFKVRLKLESTKTTCFLNSYEMLSMTGTSGT